MVLKCNDWNDVKRKKWVQIAKKSMHQSLVVSSLLSIKMPFMFKTTFKRKRRWRFKSSYEGIRGLLAVRFIYSLMILQHYNENQMVMFSNLILKDKTLHIKRCRSFRYFPSPFFYWIQRDVLADLRSSWKEWINAFRYSNLLFCFLSGMLKKEIILLFIYKCRISSYKWATLMFCSDQLPWRWLKFNCTSWNME